MKTFRASKGTLFEFSRELVGNVMMFCEDDQPGYSVPIDDLAEFALQVLGRIGQRSGIGIMPEQTEMTNNLVQTETKA